MDSAKLFTTGGSQAVRLPKDYRFDGTEVFIRREGKAVIIEPKSKRRWPRNFFKKIRISGLSGARIKAAFRQRPNSERICVQYLLDTDTCVDLLRNVSPVIEKLRALAPDDCGISAITSFELFVGAARARDPRREAQKVETLLDVVEEISFDPDAARRAGALRFELETAGTPIGPYDLLIAGHALVLDLTLVTANTEEFGHVPGLLLEKWR